MCVCMYVCVRYNALYAYASCLFTVNNVGMAADRPDYFADLSSDVSQCCKWSQCSLQMCGMFLSLAVNEFVFLSLYRICGT